MLYPDLNGCPGKIAHPFGVARSRKTRCTPPIRGHDFSIPPFPFQQSLPPVISQRDHSPFPQHPLPPTLSHTGLQQLQHLPPPPCLPLLLPCLLTPRSRSPWRASSCLSLSVSAAADCLFILLVDLSWFFLEYSSNRRSGVNQARHTTTSTAAR